jgi:hypothetical protein
MRITFSGEAEFDAFIEADLNSLCTRGETDRTVCKHRENRVEALGDDLSLDSEELELDDFPFALILTSKIN